MSSSFPSSSFPFPSSSSSPAAAAPAAAVSAVSVVEDLEWEEWDASTSPLSFAHHCLAGSFAGVMEHTLLYPLDTVKTCWQSQVLGRAASSGGGGGGGCGIFVGGALDAATSRSNVGHHQGALAHAHHHDAMRHHQNHNHNHHDRGIWSTMKHLMRQGQHVRQHHVPHHQQQQQQPRHRQLARHAYALAGSPAAPNVVDLTTAPPHSSSSSGGGGGGGLQQQQQQQQRRQGGRPWSRATREARGATAGDIVSRGTIRSSSFVGVSPPSSPAGGGAAFASAAGAVVDGGGGGGAGGGGVRRLFRGVQTMFLGCVPAHALYFSSYEVIKSACTDGGGGGASQQS